MKSKPYKDLKYQTFGRLFVLKLLPERNKFGMYQWECVCLCGNYKNVPTKYLLGKRIVSCGCIQKEQCREFGAMRKAKAQFYKVRKTADGQFYWQFKEGVSRETRAT